MSLHDEMADDMAGIFSDLDGLAITATFVPAGIDDADGRPLPVVPSDPALTMVQLPMALIERGAQQFCCARAVVRALIAAITEAPARDARRQDRLLFPAGSAFAGEWTVVMAPHDEGGQTTLTATQPKAKRGGAVMQMELDQ